MAKRYSVDFEHFENAMLTETNISWQVYLNARYKMPLERRQKVAGMLKRFAAELKPEVDAHKAEVLKKQAMIEAGHPGQSSELNVQSANGARLLQS